MRRMTLTALIVLALIATACSADTATVTSTSPTGSGTAGTTTGSGTTGGAPINAVLAGNVLVQFDQCGAFLDYVIEHALELVGPYGLETGGGYWPQPVFAVAEQALDGSPVTTFAAATGEDFATEERAGEVFSQTNLQEAGVDEPDIVKTDGSRIVALSQGQLYVVDVTGEQPHVAGSIQLNDFGVRDLFLSGNRVYAIGASYGATPYLGERGFAPEVYYPSPTSMMVEIDLPSSGDPKIVRTMAFDGSYSSARMVGDSMRVVATSTPHGFVWAQPEGGGLKAEREAEDKNREIVKNSNIDNWVPYYVITNAAGDVIEEGSLVACDRAFAPHEFAGLNMLSVMTINASEGLDVQDATGVLASGETVYASTVGLYVATQRWIDWVRLTDEESVAQEIDGTTTNIHKFDTTDPARTEYLGSGSIPGYLLNQFAMSEHEGRLRVASTTQPQWGIGEESESMITVLETEGNELVAVGQVDGLGEGERIYSVRFIGDTGYVVTFRQVDPLYTVDLSDPTNPTLQGELKIRGYSAYLHPISEDRILGVGQDATKQGQVTGTQLSLFDVSDLENPKRIDKFTLQEGSHSDVEYDHRAFLHWEDTGLTVLPVQSWSWDDEAEKSEAFFGAYGVEVTDKEIRKIADINHPGGKTEESGWLAAITRSIVIGDSLYSVSQAGIMKSDLDTLKRQAWEPFAE